MKNKNNKLRIIISNRNTLLYLKDAIKSIRQNEHYKNDIIIYDDNSGEEDRKWLVENSQKYDYEYTMINETCGEGYNRMGITLIRNRAMEESPYEVPILWFHSDMVAGKDFDKNLLKHVGKNKVVSCTRIEPPIHPSQPEVKILKDFGNTPEDFKLEQFNKFVDKKIVEHKNKVSDGVFAPSCMFKEDYFSVGGIDEDFIPQSREDSQIDYKLKNKGFGFVQVWDSLVYHYGGRGSRNKGNGKDSEEWKRSNSKNLKNFQRIWKECPHYSKTQNPSPPFGVSKVTLGILTHNSSKQVMTILENYEPFFDEFIFVDDNSTDDTFSKVDDFFKELRKNRLCVHKDYKIIKNNLSGREGDKDFAKARNIGAENSTNDWIFWLDSDELLQPALIDLLNRIIFHAETNKKTCVAFPRKNYLDKVLVNDIPFNERPGECDARESYSDIEEKDCKNLKNKDWQCRLHKKDVKWVRPVHEMLVPFYEGLFNENSEMSKQVFLYPDACIIHPKTSTKQKKQNAFYDCIVNENNDNGEISHELKKGTKPPKNKKVPNNTPKLLCNSVLFSNEGITKHAREEMKQLKELGWQINTIDKPRNGFKGEFIGEEEIDLNNDEYITYVNQPPIRKSNPKMSLQGSLGLKNIVYFLAYEGDKLPPEWVDVMKSSQIKKILTPSKYCKNIFESHGIENVEVLNHGIDDSIYKDKGKLIEFPEALEDKFIYLFVGTYRGNKKDRKGLHVLKNAWKEFKKQKGNEDAHLILKLNKVYFPGTDEEWNKSIDNLKLYNHDVTLIDDELSENKMAELLRSVDCLIAPSCSEGFGIVPLESLCCGTPVIVSDIPGFKEYITKDNALLIDCLRKTYAEEVFPYKGRSWHAQWDMPSKKSLIENIIEVRNNYSKYKSHAVENSSKLRKQFSWKFIGLELDKILKKIK